MKIRQGFVSNSSSSSFIVKIRKDDFFDKIFKTLDKKKINLLKKHGFYECGASTPENLENREKETKYFKELKDDIEKNNTKKNKKYKEYKARYLGYRVICNQDFAIDFLVYHDIGFVASIHYGHYTYIYKTGGKYIYVLNNFGIQDDDDPEKLFKNKKDMKAEGTIAYKIPRKEFVNDYKKDPSAQYLDSNSY